MRRSLQIFATGPLSAGRQMHLEILAWREKRQRPDRDLFSILGRSANDLRIWANIRVIPIVCRLKSFRREQCLVFAQNGVSLSFIAFPSRKRMQRKERAIQIWIQGSCPSQAW